MTGSLEGINVTVTFELQGFFVAEVPLSFSSVMVGPGPELEVPISARVLSDTDNDGDMEPVQGPNGLLTGTMIVDISGNEIFAQFSGQAQPAGFKVIISGLAPNGVAPGTISDAGGFSGVNIIDTPAYDAATQTLTLNWTFLGYQPGTVLNQTVFYDNELLDAPQASDDFFGVLVGRTLSGANVLNNDIDLDNGGPLGVVDLNRVTHINGVALDPDGFVDLSGGGRVKVATNGSVTFDQDGDFDHLARDVTAITSFTYTVTDSAGLTDEGIATITVTGVNTAPEITLPVGPVSISENHQTNLGLASVIADQDGDDQTITLTATTGTITLGSTTGLAFTSGDGTDDTVMTFQGALADVNTALAGLSFNPTADTLDAASISISANDGNGATSSSTLGIAITDVDPQIADQSVTLEESALTGTLVATATATQDTNGLSFSIISGNTGGAFAIDSSTGEITVADGSLLDFEGATPVYSLTIAVDDEDADSVADDTAVVTIALSDVNDAPFGADFTISAVEDTPYVFALSDFGFSDSDVPTHQLAGVIISSLPGGGTLYLDIGGGDLANATPITAGEEVSAADILAGRMLYVPPQDANGSGLASFTFQVRDDGGTSNGQDTAQTPNTITVDVAPSNDAPMLDASASPALPPISEDAGSPSGSTGIEVSAIAVSGGNVSDGDGTPSIGIAITSVASDGVLYFSVDSGASWAPVGPVSESSALLLSADARLYFQPNADFNGSIPDLFTFRAWDGSTGTNGASADVTGNGGTTAFSSELATATTVVTEFNDAPVAADDVLSDTHVNGPARTISFSSLIGNDAAGPGDESGQTLTITSVSGAVGGSVALVGGEIVFTPTAQYIGLASFEYTITDDGTTNGVADAKSDTGLATFYIAAAGGGSGDSTGGTENTDVLVGTAGKDVFSPLGGDDDIFGGEGDDSVVLPGGAQGYVIVQLANGKISVVDINPSDGDQGAKVLDSIEFIRFDNAASPDIPIDTLINMEQSPWTAETFDVGMVAAVWQLFMQMVPSGDGLEYLIHADENPNDLTDPYYALFNAENKYLNFTTNYATLNPTGEAWFQREFGDLSYEEALDKAFDLIITEDALIAAGGDPAASKQFFLNAENYFMQVAQERIVASGVDLAAATTMALLSSVLYEAIKANIGPYAEPINDFADEVGRVGYSNSYGGNLLETA